MNHLDHHRAAWVASLRLLHTSVSFVCCVAASVASLRLRHPRLIRLLRRGFARLFACRTPVSFRLLRRGFAASLRLLLTSVSFVCSAAASPPDVRRGYAPP